MEEECEPRVPLGFLLLHGRSCFSFRDYVAREVNFVLWISLIAVTFLLLQKLARIINLWAKGDRIPGPPSSSLFFFTRSGRGKHARLGSARDLTGYLLELHEQYGSVVRLWLSPTKLLISVTDVADINEMLIKAKDNFSLSGWAFPLVCGTYGIFVSSYEKVLEGREYLELFMNGKLLERVNKIPLKVAGSVLGRVETIMSKGILDCKSISQHISFNILGVELFEEAFLKWSNATLYEEILMTVAKDARFWASYKVPPFWNREYWRYQLLCIKLKHLTQDIVVQCDSLFKGKKEGHLISKEEACGNILGMMFHGFPTITNFVYIILKRLVLHPELQEKIFSEITEVQEKTSKRDSYDVEKMHLLVAAVYESARLLPPGHLLQRCSLNHDMRLKPSVTLPADAILVVPLRLVQMDSSIWGEDACQFNPHRFLSKAINKDGVSEEHGISELSRNLAYLPFGSASRACIGQKFAILGIAKLFASLLHNYEIRLEPGSQNELKLTINECRFQLIPSPKIVFLKRSN